MRKGQILLMQGKIVSCHDFFLQPGLEKVGSKLILISILLIQILWLVLLVHFFWALNSEGCAALWHALQVGHLCQKTNWGILEMMPYGPLCICNILLGSSFGSFVRWLDRRPTK